jgi:hypothetical protein
MARKRRAHADLALMQPRGHGAVRRRAMRVDGPRLCPPYRSSGITLRCTMNLGRAAIDETRIDASIVSPLISDQLMKAAPWMT